MHICIVKPGATFDPKTKTELKSIDLDKAHPLLRQLTDAFPTMPVRTTLVASVESFAAVMGDHQVTIWGQVDGRENFYRYVVKRIRDFVPENKAADRAKLEAFLLEVVRDASARVSINSAAPHTELFTALDGAIRSRKQSPAIRSVKAA